MMSKMWCNLNLNYLFCVYLSILDIYHFALQYCTTTFFLYALHMCIINNKVEHLLEGMHIHIIIHSMGECVPVSYFPLKNETDPLLH